MLFAVAATEIARGQICMKWPLGGNVCAPCGWYWVLNLKVSLHVHICVKVIQVVQSVTLADALILIFDLIHHR